MDSLDGQFQKFRWTKLLPSPPLWGYSNNPKKGGLIQETDTLQTTFGEWYTLLYEDLGRKRRIQRGGTPQGVRFVVPGCDIGYMRTGRGNTLIISLLFQWL